MTTMFKYGTEMDYKAAIDLAFELSSKETDGWYYTVEIAACKPSQAKIAVYDEDDIKLGYL
jgi:hypothetical protein